MRSTLWIGAATHLPLVTHTAGAGHCWYGSSLEVQQLMFVQSERTHCALGTCAQLLTEKWHFSTLGNTAMHPCLSPMQVAGWLMPLLAGEAHRLAS